MCDDSVKSQSLGLIFHTLEEEKLGSSALMADTVPPNVQNSLLRLLDSVLLAQKNVQMAAMEAVRDRCTGPFTGGVTGGLKSGESNHLPCVCIL